MGFDGVFWHSHIEYEIITVEISQSFPSTPLRAGIFQEGIIVLIMRFCKLEQFGPGTAFHIFFGYGKQTFLGLAIKVGKVQIDHYSKL